MKKRMLSMLLAIVMVVGLLPGMTLTASAAGEKDHTSHDGWTPITKFSDITAPGNYYIANGFTFGYYDRKISASGTVNLCLNGASVSYNYATTIISGTTVNICDCSADKTGTLGCSVTNNGTLNLYGGKIGGQIKNDESAALNIYGGSVEYGGNHAVTNNGTMKVYGGSITATGSSNYAIENNDVLLIEGGTFESKGNVCIDNDGTDAKIEGGNFTANGSYSVIRNNGGSKMEISGGTFTGKGENTGCVLQVSANGTMNVSNGTFTGGGTVISNRGTTSISGGSFTSTATADNRYVVDTSTKLNISGGTFTHQNKEASLYVWYKSDAEVPISLSGGTFTKGIKVTCYKSNGYSTAYPKDLLAEGYAYYQNDAVVVINSSNQYKPSITGGDVIVKKEPKVETYTITFDANGGTVSTTSATTNLNSKLDSLPTPPRDNYKFDGWFDAQDGGAQIVADTAYTKSMTVYAHWTPNTYKITYHLYDNETKEGSYTYGEGTTLKKDVIRGGYRFRGWYKDTACTNGPYGAIGEKSNVNYTFYAKWVLEYAVTVQTTGNGSVSADISKAIENETVTLTIAPAAGYDLAFISVKDAGGADVTLSGEGDTRTFKMPAGSVTVAATFAQAQVTFDANGGTGTMDAVTVSGANYALPTCGFTAPATTVPGGMKFKGWAYSEDGEVISTDSITVTGNTKLFAIWEYTPDRNQTIEKSGVFSKQHTFEIDLGALLPTDAKIEKGISISSSGVAVASTTPQIEVGSNSASLRIVTRITSGPANDTVVMKVDTENYGEFTFIVNVTLTGYTITYNLDGGSVETANPAAYTVETDTFTLTNPTKTGYTFKGWSGTGLTGDENLTVTIAKGSTGDRTYTAQWEPISFYVVLRASADTGADTRYVLATYGQPLDMSEYSFDPPSAGYTLSGWNSKGDGSGKVSCKVGETISADGVKTLFDHAYQEEDGLYYFAYLTAQWTECYSIWVGGVQVTGVNKDDVLSDGGSVKYDPDTNTLTLTDAAIKNPEGSGIYAENMDLIINGVDTDAAGDNTVSGTDVMETGVDEDGYEYTGTTPGNGIEVQNGSLTIIGTLGDISSGEIGDGIMVDGDVTIEENSAVGNIVAGGNGISSMGAVTVAGTVGDITAAENGGGNGIGADDDVIVSGSVGSISAGYAGLHTAGGDITISGEIGSITGGNAETGGSGIEALPEGIYDEDTEEYYYTDGDVTITGTVGKITGGAAGIYAGGLLTIENTTVVLAAGDGYAFAVGKGYLLTDVIISSPEVYDLGSIDMGTDEGYTTIGTSSWTDDGDSFTPASSVTFEPGYTVSFYDALGDGTHDQAIPTGKTAREPVIPACKGYTFEGWYTSSDYGETLDEKYDFSASVTDEVTLYAKWTANTYAVTLVTNNGTIRESDVTEYTYGIGATLPTNVTRSGYYFGGWYDNENCTGTAVTEITETDLGDKTFYAKWTYIYIPPTYIPTIEDTTGGDTTVSDKNPEKGDKVTITTDPDKGYEVGEITVTDSKGNKVEVIDNGDGTYTYVQPVGKVTITVSYVCSGTHNCPSLAYSDLNTSLWYHEATDYVLTNGLMNGVGNGKFDPNGTTSRAMIVTILWRLEGQPVVNYLMQFEDVPSNTWYTEAVRWAASEKIVEGYSDTAFGPNDPITREQFATILWRYAKYKGYDVSVGEDTNILSYEDAFDISEWAIPAMQWACGAGLMQGDGVNLTPKADATRAQAAALFQRFCENVAEK